MLIRNSNPVIHQELRTATHTELVLVPITNVVFSWMPHETKVSMWLKSLSVWNLAYWCRQHNFRVDSVFLQALDPVLPGEAEYGHITGLEETWLR